METQLHLAGYTQFGAYTMPMIDISIAMRLEVWLC